MAKRTAKKKTKHLQAREGWKGVHVYAGKVFRPVEHPERWLSIPEACALANKTRKTMHKYIENKTVVSRRHGFYRLIDRASLQRLVTTAVC